MDSESRFAPISFSNLPIIRLSRKYGRVTLCLKFLGDTVSHHQRPSPDPELKNMLGLSLVKEAVRTDLQTWSVLAVGLFTSHCVEYQYGLLYGVTPFITAGTGSHIVNASERNQFPDCGLSHQVSPHTRAQRPNRPNTPTCATPASRTARYYWGEYMSEETQNDVR